LEVISLEGKFVRLVPLDLGHAAALLTAANEDRSSYTFTSVPRDAIEMRMFIHLAQAEYDRGASIPFATVDAKTSRLVGSTRFMSVDRWHPYFEPAPTRDSPPSALEIGSTWLAGSAQRTAINTEAKLLMLRHAFEVWKVQRVTLKTDARNERSRAAILRLGAQLDGVLRAWQLASDGGPRDTAIFSILSGEWPAVRTNLEGALTLERSPPQADPD
jgi:RimJ/RimL family protein N-acetyltransferase